MKKVMLIIRDGWGYSDQKKGNAINAAHTPFDDWLVSQPHHVLLACHGKQVGLPEGFQGSSEVGHLNMGAGRIVEQEVTRIFDAIESGAIFEYPGMRHVQNQLSETNAIHFFGLLQDEGVHAHQEHLFQLYKNFRTRFPETPIWIHPVSDGRDTPPKSFSQFFRKLLEIIKDDSLTGIGTVWGRYYGMDRSWNWDLIKVALDAMISGKGKLTKDFLKSVSEAYKADFTPDNVPMFDEYLQPMVHESYPGIKSGDTVINFNYRQDRAIQISQAFTSPDCPLYQPEFHSIRYYGLTRYYDEFENYLMPPMDDSGGLDNILGEVLSRAGKTQLRIAETQKFRHVTSFFNGKSTRPFNGETQIEIPSKWDPATFANHPEMNAEDVTIRLMAEIDNAYDFIAVNYANCDMVGHTGDFNAARAAAEIVDKNVQSVAQKAMNDGYYVIITADHGNSEEMLDKKGEVKTSHTTNAVFMHLISKENSFKLTTDHGKLSDIAGLILTLMGLPIPDEMTSRTLSENLKVLH